MGKNKKDKGEKKTKQKNTAAIDERFKKALAIQPPDENPFKMDNENKIDRFRYSWKTDWRSIKTVSRQKRRDSRPKKPKRRVF
ncbi:hypothetical protein KY363_07430 [Candidatus Woesearchaeota archaeon]|nr:hypothetical protein [Candidatus Woesearchaeota archaeon]